jgi:hypothetical protein
MELYLDIPSEEWDALQDKAEDLLIEEEIGQHILGIYPTGNAIFGIPGAAPSIICLYLDSAEGYLDPFISTDNIQITVNNNLSTITFINIKNFIGKLKNPDNISLSVCFGDILYQDDSIDNLMSLCQEYLSNNIIYDFTIDYLNIRTALIFNITKEFKPKLQDTNLIDIIDNLSKDSYLQKLDKQLEKEILDKKHITNINTSSYFDIATRIITKLPKTNKNLYKLQDNIKQETIRFLKFIF